MGLTYDEIVARNVRSARARAGISQGQMSARMKQLGYTSWSGGKVSLCEQGKRPILASELLPLAITLECTITDLVGANAADGDIQLRGGWEIGAVSVRNLGHGVPDPAVSWSGPDGLDLSITMPASPASVSTWNKAFYEPV